MHPPLPFCAFARLRALRVLTPVGIVLVRFVVDTTEKKIIHNKRKYPNGFFLGKNYLCSRPLANLLAPSAGSTLSLSGEEPEETRERRGEPLCRHRTGVGEQGRIGCAEEEKRVCIPCYAGPRQDQAEQ